MSAQGLDKDRAPEPELAKRMLDSIGGRWWNVYIGGPESGGHGWTPALVKEYVRHGIDRFMLTYVGRQKRGPLTRPQGRKDGLEALRIAKSFGYSGSFPLCLDVEMSTFESAPSGTIEYTRAWCAAVRGGGARPGVYANPGPLKAMAQAHVGADFVWVASWVNHGATPHDTGHIPQLPDNLWAGNGSRAWQYAGAFGGKPCQVLGVDVDINVADLGCLAKPPGPHKGGEAPRSRLIRRGDRGPRVERLTRRLSAVRSQGTRAPYLDGPRRRFDRGAEAALISFQREHGLDPDGVYGSATARALARALKRQRRRRGDADGRPKKKAAELRELIQDVRRLDAETERAWERLVAYGERRQQTLHKAADGADDGALGQIAKTLERMEHTLETLVQVEQRELKLQEEELELERREHQPPPAEKAEQPYASAASTAPETTATMTAGAVGPNGDVAAATVPPARERLDLDDLSDEELQERVERLDRATDRARVVLMRRYIQTEKKLARIEPKRRGPREPVREPVRERDKPREPRKGRGKRKPEEHVRELQTALNRFTDKYLESVPPLIADGERGQLTNKRIRRVKFYLGYKAPEHRSSKVDADFMRRLEHPRSPRASSPAMVARGTARRRKQHKHAREAAKPRAGVAMFAGKPVAAWMKPHLDFARANGWTGFVYSGYRTPEESEAICFGMCGGPKCPGKCGGRDSNHSGRVVGSGALDVSDHVTFGALMKRSPHRPRIFNDLPNDINHFSSTGH
ncbi:MAG TPA: glycoside hydrolase domain-containing protein [Thermoleophilaceae bacterium]|nr:glycoside hydrolase domain-containing protein [Thermoleophilaceae bacterium]